MHLDFSRTRSRSNAAEPYSISLRIQFKKMSRCQVFVALLVLVGCLVYTNGQQCTQSACEDAYPGSKCCGIGCCLSKNNTLCWQNQQISDKTMRKYSSCSSLLQRIRDQHLRDAWNTQIEYIQKAWISLFFYFVVLLIFQCHNRVYNAWEGPFPMDLYQFRNHLNMNYNLFGFKSFFSFRWFLFQPEYIQIELGKNVIDQSIENTFRVFYGHYSYEKLLYTFNRVVEPMIDTSHMPLFIKFYAYKQSYPQIHYPYRFQSLNINTLRCIGKQLGISSREFIHCWEQQEQLRYEQETQRAQGEEQRRRLELIIEEEVQHQQHVYGHDINRILQGIRSASPRFIAQFRLNGWQIVSHDLLDYRCSICLEDLQLNQRIARWPCQARHTFHFDCMLDVLRAGNTCPLCRHPVEAADLPNAEAVVWLLLRTMMPNAST
ncbi:unnamed protein product [Rotaria sordida]|uniref:RING-type domain-containing protein n=2 Tax=Rotaria sordida TaxID=392033 RepID=A0A814DWM7_9BILA|nr:unnamed protein product [Rotaria sordida]